MNKIALACLVGLGVLAGGLAAWSAVSKYRSRGSRQRKQVKTVEDEPKEALAEQLV